MGREYFLTSWANEALSYGFLNKSEFEIFHEELHKIEREILDKEKMQQDLELLTKAKTLNCSIELTKYIQILEFRISQLEDKIREYER